MKCHFIVPTRYSSFTFTFAAEQQLVECSQNWLNCHRIQTRESSCKDIVMCPRCNFFLYVNKKRKENWASWAEADTVPTSQWAQYVLVLSDNLQLKNLYRPPIYHFFITKQHRVKGLKCKVMFTGFVEKCLPRWSYAKLVHAGETTYCRYDMHISGWAETDFHRYGQ